ncbi:MAG: Maf family protein [Desulfobacteraceae bacterium]|nr:septum formation inhibitor Maf [Pseudomonadota bacterium]MBU4463440.1 septum formation inhibitor Maf [Pseudomonadota bacterium]MCG2755467.1 Maf family protein [Desulfobacteraceae bacterium]NQT09697.1 septum formation inhibitor Maf [Desulfobacteraceae bacterium]
MQKSCDSPILILASKSPRRRYLLEQAGLCFSVIPSDFDEKSVSLPLSETYGPETYVRVLAEKKAHDVSKRYPENWVIGADTIVLIGDTILGKPGSKAEAKSMLKRLGGQVHQVLTGYCICCEAKNKGFSETIKTEVLFKNLADEEIEWYINTKEPFDKAGAYAIQGLGTFLVKSINGSYTNVVGLPVCEIIEFLIKEGVVGRQEG